ncbi:hypothetical protein [Spiroplasma endosymbiont of Dioctria linearis]|uniref:hypothetical protein n=1 Tax=Spiroplasma endosymbiont of Dioctria linearis TaxID=3066290 RepID=UPI00313B38A4
MNKFTNKIQKLHKLNLFYLEDNYNESINNWTNKFSYIEIENFNQLVSIFISMLQKYVDNNSNFLLKKDIRKKLNLLIVKYKKYFTQFNDSYLKFKTKNYEFFDYKNAFQIVSQNYKLKNKCYNIIEELNLNKSIEQLFKNISNLNKNEVLTKLSDLLFIKVDYSEVFHSYSTVEAYLRPIGSIKIKLDLYKDPFKKFLIQEDMIPNFNNKIKGFDNERLDKIGKDIGLKLSNACKNHDFDFWTPTGNKIRIIKKTYFEFINNNHIFSISPDFKIYFSLDIKPTKNSDLIIIDRNNNALTIQDFKKELNNLNKTESSKAELFIYECFLRELKLL